MVYSVGGASWCHICSQGMVGQRHREATAFL
jgi:hypothetical protein